MPGSRQKAVPASLEFTSCCRSAPRHSDAPKQKSPGVTWAFMSGKRDLNPRPSPWQEEQGWLSGGATGSSPVDNGAELFETQESDRPTIAPPTTPGLMDLVTQWLPDFYSGETPIRLFTVPDVAERLKVSRATVYKLVSAGSLPHVRVANSILVPADALAQYLHAARRSPGSP